MGTKLVPSHANLFMTKSEEKDVYTYPLKTQIMEKVLLISF